MICRFVGSAMDLAQSVQDFVQAGWFLFTAVKWLFSFTGSRAHESGIDRCVISIVTIVLVLVSVASGLAVAISGFRSARFACIIAATG